MAMAEECTSSSSNSGVPMVKFNNGLQCPILGLGTYRSKESAGIAAVKTAIDSGYRHIDTALYYTNETEVGIAVAEKIAEGVIKREDIFVTSKLWNSFHRKDLVKEAINKTLQNLGMDYIDLYLIHWPMAYKDGWELNPKDNEGKLIHSDTSYIETWQAMEELVECGQVKSIGLSNFNREQIQRILDIAKIKPVNNQIECHPYFNQDKLVGFCQSKGITVTAFRPLGGPPDNLNNPINNPTIQMMADKYEKTPAQIMIKFLIQRGIITIPKSTNPERIKSNFNVFNFELNKEDMNSVFSLDQGPSGRSVLMPNSIGTRDYPFSAVY